MLTGRLPEVPAVTGEQEEVRSGQRQRLGTEREGAALGSIAVISPSGFLFLPGMLTADHAKYEPVNEVRIRECGSEEETWLLFCHQRPTAQAHQEGCVLLGLRLSH